MPEKIDDLQFVSIDLSHPQVNMSSNNDNKTTLFPASIWEAAKSCDIDALDYYIQNVIHEKNNDEDDNDKEKNDVTSILNSRDPETCCTLLHLAISHSKNPLKAVSFLLQKGANAMIPNIYGLQAIHAVILCCPEPLECVRLLLKYDHHINACDNDNWTPLHYAARFCKDPEPIFQELINKGADINSINAANKTPLFALLASGDHSHVIKWTLDKIKVDLHIKGDFLNTQTGQTRTGSILIQAVKYGRIECLQVLIDYIITAGILNSVTDRQELLFGIDIAKEESKTSCMMTGKFMQIIDILHHALQQFDMNKALSIVDLEKQSIVIKSYAPFSFLQRLIWNYTTQ